MKKKLIASVAIGTMITPLLAVEVYKEEGKTVNVYGNIKAITGYIGNKSFTNPKAGDSIFRLQGNSRLGVKADLDNLFGVAEIGLKDTSARVSTLPIGFRYLYAGYTFGDSGTLIVGKTLSLEGTDFSSDIFNSDSGLVGFGNGSQGAREFQVQYLSTFGLSFALVQNALPGQPSLNGGVPAERQITGANNVRHGMTVGIPTIAVSYDFKNEDENLIGKVGVSYATRRVLSDSQSYNNTGKKVTINAYMINAAVTYKMLDKKLYFSVMGGYNVNGSLYTDNTTPIFTNLNETGNLYGNGKISNDKFENISSAYGAIEVGYAILDNLKAMIGGGYQYSKNKTFVNGASTGKYENNNADSYAGFVELAYKPMDFLTLVPHVGYYGVQAKRVQTSENTYARRTSSQFFGVMQTKLDF